MAQLRLWCVDLLYSKRVALMTQEERGKVAWSDSSVLQVCVLDLPCKVNKLDSNRSAAHGQ